MSQDRAGIAPRRRWRPPLPPPAALAELAPHPVLAAALARRGLREPEAARAFLAREAGDTNPFRLRDMDRAVTRLRAALRAGEPIAVYGDYDADGVTATALLCQALRALGGEPIPFIPHRERDGYGLSEHAIARLARRGARVLVTVDCGIRGAAEVAAAKGLGLDVIVTDHHSVPDELPEALAVINPRRGDDGYGFEGLAGVGMAFKLAQALLRVEARTGGTAPLAEDELLDLVALGTVADVVPLLGENRALVHRGLEVLRAARRPGVRALCEAASVEPAELRARDIAFVLGPRINAAGRMQEATAALQLLLAADPARAAELAGQLERMNHDRRAATDVALEAADAALAGRTDEPLLFHASPDIALGVVGLVAGRLARAHDRPALVLRREDGRARGSMRSIPQLDAVAALEAADDLLLRWGGHPAAGGLTVALDRLDDLEARLRAFAAETLAGQDLRGELLIDAELRLAELDWDLYEALAELEPFGANNPEPLLLARGLEVRQARIVGTDHLKMTVADGPARFEAIAFRQADLFDALGPRVDLVFRLSVNHWQGRSRLELVVEDMASPGA